MMRPALALVIVLAVSALAASHAAIRCREAASTRDNAWVLCPVLGESQACGRDQSAWCSKPESKTWCRLRGWAAWMMDNCPTLCCSDGCCFQDKIKLLGSLLEEANRKLANRKLEAANVNEKRKDLRFSAGDAKKVLRELAVDTEYAAEMTKDSGKATGTDSWNPIVNVASKIQESMRAISGVRQAEQAAYTCDIKLGVGKEPRLARFEVAATLLGQNGRQLLGGGRTEQALRRTGLAAKEVAAKAAKAASSTPPPPPPPPPTHSQKVKAALEEATKERLAKRYAELQQVTPHPDPGVGFCVLEAGDDEPVELTANVHLRKTHLYCAATTVPTGVEVRGCKSSDGGFILIKHKKEELVSVRDVSGKKTTARIDYIKVSACAAPAANSKERELPCTVKKLVYKCDSKAAGESDFKKGCDDIQRNTAGMSI